MLRQTCLFLRHLISKMTKDTAAEKWALAIPLAEAWLQYASEELRAEFQGLQTGIEAFGDAAQSDQNPGIGAAILAGLAANSDRRRLMTELQKQLLVDLFNSEFQAIGYRLLPTKSHRPVVINADLFDTPKIDWQNSTIQWLGNSFYRIRVFDPQSQSEGFGKGSTNAIDRAIAELILSNYEFCNLPRKVSCEMVRNKIGAKPISGDGLSNQNITKRILAQCPKRAIK